MSAFGTYTIRDIGRVVTGKTPSTADQANFGVDFPFLTPTDMQGAKWARRTGRGISAAGAKKLRTLVPKGAVAVSCIGWQMGKAILIDRPTYTNQQINTIIPNALADSGYLYYHFATRRDELLSIASAGGVRTPIISKSSFEALKVALPPLAVQRLIASILSAYDDLIENNTRRIANLEEMARRIYEEWFVRFRFPGHENVRMVESKLGSVPGAWKSESLEDCANVTMGQSPSSDFYNETGSGLPFHQGVTNFGAHFPTHKQYCSVDGRLANDGDILVSVRAPVGRINLSPCRLVIGRGLCAIQSKNGQQTFLLHRLKETFKEEDSMGNGAIFKAVSKQEVLGLSFLRPPEPLIVQFESIAAPMWALIRNLTAKNECLRATRDLLLPKLISGELDASFLQKTEAAVA